MSLSRVVSVSGNNFLTSDTVFNTLIPLPREF